MSLKIVFCEESEYAKRVETAFSQSSTGRKLNWSVSAIKKIFWLIFLSIIQMLSLHLKQWSVPAEIRRREIPVSVSERAERGTGKNEIFRYQKFDNLVEEMKKKLNRQEREAQNFLFLRPCREEAE